MPYAWARSSTAGPSSNVNGSDTGSTTSNDLADLAAHPTDSCAYGAERRAGTGVRLSTMDTPAMLVAAAVATLPDDRRDWGAAMAAELAQVPDRRSRWWFAAGCARTAVFPPHDNWAPVLAGVALAAAALMTAGLAIGGALSAMRVFAVTFTRSSPRYQARVIRLNAGRRVLADHVIEVVLPAPRRLAGCTRAGHRDDHPDSVPRNVPNPVTGLIPAARLINSRKRFIPTDTVGLPQPSQTHSERRPPCRAWGLRVACAFAKMLRVSTLRVRHTADLLAGELAQIRGLLDRAFAGRFDDTDWDHALGGLHITVVEDDQVVAHAAVVQRQLVHDNRPIRTGYVEAVAVDLHRRGRGHAAAIMGEAERVIREAYDLGALSASGGVEGFYLSRGWLAWQGPTYVLTPGGIIRTPHDDDRTFVLAVPGKRLIRVTGMLACDWRDGDVW